MNIFKLYFEEDLKKLGLKRYTVCKMLSCTGCQLYLVELRTQESFTVDEIQTLKENGFESMDRLI